LPFLRVKDASRILLATTRMMPRQSIPVLFTCLAAYLHGSSLTRLHLLAIIFVKPFLALVCAALLLFIVRHSAEICRTLLLGPSFWIAWSLASMPRHQFPWRIQSDIEIPAPPFLRPLFQRPPPSLSV
jgi:hypothetical protein